jgi:predicted flap endonuclease-1-like 5' DNA nuclease
MHTSLKQIKGINQALADAFKKHGIASSEDFLAAARTPSSRKELSAKTQVDGKMILELANRCDLTRLKGVSGVYSDLLEETGVDTVRELAGRIAENLHKKMLETNEAKRLTQRPPALGAVKSWIAQAKGMAAGIEY